MCQPAQEEMAEAAAWLATEDGHRWQDERALAVAGTYGLTASAWISVKGDAGGISASWLPRKMTPKQVAMLRAALIRQE